MQWDIFCRVIDNLGDIGVCWRLCAGLAARQQRVRLWIDVPDDLDWMVPGAREGHIHGVEVIHWTEPLQAACAGTTADVWIEAFGCDPAHECLDELALRVQQGAAAPVWLNLEYMSAEAYVERCHRLPSPIMTGPLQGLTKWFFYPGFTPRTGGLLREADLPARQAAFDAAAWLASQSLPVSGLPRASLFCYEPPALRAVLQEAGAQAPSDWLVTTGRAADAVAAERGRGLDTGQARLHTVQRLTQHDYDHLLWSCDLNFVRGEDSLVRALWTGKPFVWHIYPQHDNAHHAKLEAFLDWLEAPPSLRDFHRAWNGITAPGTVWPGWDVVNTWQPCALAARQRLQAQPDLIGQLIGFVTGKR
ncbi:elongation factor P maturation arginine rhamnosyltransferase EarP [Hydrogenophaga flava]|uniref:elongation factor P maturation arginine rhamnosyltransferase EarP n=1 Tax=Hydrogenophaga flava TaxID=65657 RepID=UPI000A549142|nr:elongation factor P maturation arginine rhamnosyltransferase EarP [Hydrogenophaga flava]